MSPEIYAVWKEILAGKNVGNTVLGIGAVPTTDSLLDLEIFGSCTTLLGINIDGGQNYAVGGDTELHNEFEIIEGNANDMQKFPDEFFDTVVSNSVLEHDKYFWRTLSEIRRVAKTGALVVIGTLGYDSPQAYREVIFEGMELLELHSVLDAAEVDRRRPEGQIGPSGHLKVVKIAVFV